MENNKNTTLSSALFLVAGGVIGAGVALLYAPKSGEKTRRDISRYGRRIKKQADETIDDIGVQINDMMESLNAKTDEILQKGKEVAGGARKDLMSLIEDGSSRLEKFRAKLTA